VVGVMNRCDAVLLIAFGGPERLEDIRPYLEIVGAGRPIPRERLDAVAHHYEAIGGRSPLGELTRRQATGLGEALAREGIPLPVYVGMRNWHPFLSDTLAKMRDAGHRRAFGIVLSPLRTEASWDRYLNDVAAARDKMGADAPGVEFAEPWAHHPLFVETMAERAAVARARVRGERRETTHLVFTAHSVPAAMAQASPYADQFATLAKAIAHRLGAPHWSIAYQSRSGAPRDPWLEPDIGDLLRSLAAQGTRDVVVVPVGFVVDHVEVLYDLDVEARKLAADLGLGFERALTANDHPLFIAMLLDLVKHSCRPTH
jgi:ferrochelatase